MTSLFIIFYLITTFHDTSDISLPIKVSFSLRFYKILRKSINYLNKIPNRTNFLSKTSMSKNSHFIPSA